MPNYEIDENGFVCLPGSEEWRASYQDGENLAKKFSGQSAHDFAAAVSYNESGPLQPGVKIIDLVCLKKGERDESAWVWKVTLHTGEIWKMTAGCDYTGWDCQSWNSWEVSNIHDCPSCSCNS